MTLEHTIENSKINLTAPTLAKSESKLNFWIFFVFIALGEFFCFRYAFIHTVQNTYPAAFDQTSYLSFFYVVYENVKQQGFISGILNSPPLATGIFFPIQAILYFSVFGASRFSAMLINFTYFMILQLCCIKLISTLSNKKYFAYLFLAILFLMNVPSFRVGGILDMRMDFIAFCVYGIFLCSVIKSSYFLNRKWTFITVLAAGLLILLRTLTLVYVVGLSVSLFAYLLIKKWSLQRNKQSCQQINNRLVNLIIFCFFIGLITLPFIWLNRVTLYNYYVIGHILGSEKYIRAAQEGITNMLSACWFYPRMLLFKQIGISVLSICLFFSVIYSYFYITTRKINLSDSEDYAKWGIGFFYILFSILIPLAALTSDINKSPVVASIMVIPFIWLVFWYWLYVDSKLQLSKQIIRILNVSAIILLALGIINQVNQYHHGLSKNQKKDLAVISTMYLDIGNYVVSKQWENTPIAFDQIRDYLTSNGIVIIYYETNGKLLNINTEKLGGSIFAIDKQGAINSLNNSKVLVVNLNGYPDKSFFPFDQSIESLRPTILQYANQHFNKLGDYPFMDSVYRVYVKAN
ncbi:MAG: hypothetical protein P4M12_05465 [Gammaproteobacteria bacterium]|nr:hypothetical protein [Gammaproteobacteria bacterium]